MLPLLLALSLAHAAPGVAVLELYTSEGCSSCPAADQLLISLQQEARAQRIAVYPLAFHVDYWNRLGWPDPYSSADWSARQGDWQGRLGNSNIYTPQLIINGSAELVGSDEAAARAALRAALGKPAEVSLSAQATALGDSAVKLKVNLTGLSQVAVVSAALVEDGLSTVVPRGENAGRTLHHTAVVRSLASIDATGPGELSLRLTVPSGVDRSKARVVVFVQDRRDGKVIGATETAL